MTLEDIKKSLIANSFRVVDLDSALEALDTLNAVDDPHAVDDYHPCFICGSVVSHDHSSAEWYAALAPIGGLAEYRAASSYNHGYTCGICSWGRVDQPRTKEDYDAHMGSEHAMTGCICDTKNRFSWTHLTYCPWRLRQEGKYR